MRNKKFIWFTSVVVVLYFATISVFYQLPFKTGTTVFQDVDQSHWAAYDIEYMYDQGLMKGRDETVFNFYPEAVMTRAELVALMLRVDGADLAKLDQTATVKYTDIPSGHWSIPVLAEAEKRNLIPFKDVAQGKFQPDKPVTRGELSQGVVQSLHLQYSTLIDGIQPVNDIGGNLYEPAISTMLTNKYAKGYEDNTFRPNENASRATVASLFAKALRENRPETKTDANAKKKGGNQ
ncbi:S-layer homology domain-containing protein [Tumebacillus sp. ITR2]|uniref:S-layer homology domain-containing protein n=1 Tax=Tumebacillus amylolyticus TaxID=2801339 RepID=A0ABS1J5I4_9BACL|nr:S-layer homology domain-containing protein [Tumebacillus amylolyticus]MBL0385470.1 S-layer homology domain-containing protein [Tumebacillus amylolyticus]